MRINEMVNLNELLQSDNWKSKFGDSSNADTINKYAGQLNSVMNDVKKYSSLNSETEQLSFTANKLNSYIDTLNNIDTEYKNPLTTTIEKTGQTIDRQDTDRLKTQISQFVNEYNKTRDKAADINSATMTSDIDTVKTTNNLEKIGIKKNKDGSLSFDEKAFDNNIKAGETKLEDLKPIFTDLTTMTSAAATASRNVNKEIDAAYNTAAKQIAELRVDFTTEQQDYLKSSLNALFNTNSLNSMLAGLGIGRNLNGLI